MAEVDFVSNSRGDWLVHVSVEDLAELPDRFEMHPDKAFLCSGALRVGIADFGPAVFLAMLPSVAEKGKIIVALMRDGDLVDAVEIPVVVSGAHG